MNSLKRLALATCLATASMAKAAAIDLYTPSCGPVGITKACESNSLFAAFPGKYTVHLKIGDRAFEDGMEINYITTHPGMLSVAEVVSGFFSVPSASFVGPILNGKIGLTLEYTMNAFEMTFEIRMKENGQTFPVYFYVKGPSNLNACENEGTAYLDAARTRPFGKFTMVKDNNECKCR